MPTISETIRIRGNDKIALEIKIGNGQIGGYSFLLDSRSLTPKTTTPRKSTYALGEGADLRFRVLIGTVKVKDVQRSTNRTTVTLTVRQGTSVRQFRETEQATEGGVVNYGVALTFI